MSANAPSIPQEIVGTIISWLSDQKDTLLGASLVSQSFLAPCQALLFRNIDILGEGPNKLHKLRHSLERNPAIATYARSVRLQVTRSLVADPDLPWILDQFKILSKLSIDSRAPAPVDWKDFSGDLQRSVLECLRLPTITSLSARFITTLPLSIFQDSQSLRRLNFTGIQFPVPVLDHSDTSAHKPPPLRLEALSLSCSSFKEADTIPFYDLIIRAPRLFTFEDIAELDVEVWEKTLLPIKHVLRSSNSVLTILSLALRGPHDLDLSCLSGVCGITISVDLTPIHLEGTGSPPERFLSMTRTLGTINSPSFKWMRLLLEVDGPNLRKVDWSELDEVLTNLRRSGTLERLTIEIEYPMFWDPFLDNWEIREEDVVPLLPKYNSTRGLLKIMECI
ncbi:hypothetical protein BDN72DRAFT_846708 [Pluteus cervinus]|uniref:Uncharacterized protein n=1 Tax=Pluteus cervinus TaxID=181527 RepID=A0ACD3AFG2_9AGAR|nr:hypothetical protein BDN72DRAFT_846708 [Pluteus cervinus]